jgi:hypothetical protein
MPASAKRTGVGPGGVMVVCDHGKRPVGHDSIQRLAGNRHAVAKRSVFTAHGIQQFIRRQIPGVTIHRLLQPVGSFEL